MQNTFLIAQHTEKYMSITHSSNWKDVVVMF